METSDTALDIQNLRHAFKNHKALDDVSFSVPRQSIHGFVGPNGAGKTTSLKIIATLLRPQTGSVRVFDLDVAKQTRQVRSRIGFMPDHFSMYRQMTVFEYLDFFAAAYGQGLRQRNTTIHDVLELTDMSGRRGDLIRGLSRGMQQRVSLARVLVHDPDLLLFDEPASGLDPRARIELMEILRALQQMGKTIFISSHILSELATLCTSVTIIDRGQIKFTGSMDRLLAHEHSGPTYDLVLAERVEGFDTAMRKIDGVSGVQVSETDPRYVISIDPDVIGTGDLLRAALDLGAQVIRFNTAQKHLNDAFMALTDPGVRS